MTDSGTAGSHAAVFQQAATRYRQGDYPAALQLCERIIATAPAAEALAATLNLKALILAQRGCLFSAVECLESAIGTRRDDPKLHEHAARANLAAGRMEPAAHHAREASRLEPGSVTYRYQLARILRLAGDLEGSEREARSCPDSQPAFCEALILLSELAVDRNDPRAAVDCLREVIDREPGHVRAWAMLAEADGRLTSDLPVEATLRRLASAAPGREDVATARFALAGYALRRAEHEAAFGLLREANDIRALQAPFDIDGWEGNVERTLQSGCDNGCEQTPGEDLVFVVGMPRSGTTLCEQVLSAHPRVLGAGEVPAMEYVRAELVDRGLGPEGTDAGPDVIAALRLAYRESLPRGREDVQLVVDKAPRNFERIGLILRLFPAARVVWMLRHPLDTIFSCYTQDFGPGQAFSNRLDHAARFLAGQLRLLEHWTRLHGSTIRVVDYEEMVTGLEHTVRGLVDFLGLSFDPAMLRPDLNPRRARTASAEQVRRPVHPGGIGRWQDFAAQLGDVRAMLEAQGLLESDGSSRVRAAQFQ